MHVVPRKYFLKFLRNSEAFLLQRVNSFVATIAMLLLYVVIIYLYIMLLPVYKMSLTSEINASKFKEILSRVH